MAGILMRRKAVLTELETNKHELRRMIDAGLLVPRFLPPGKRAYFLRMEVDALKQGRGLKTKEMV